MISNNQHSESKKNHGLVEFQEPVRLNKVQQQQANGYKELITIDWGDFERQGWSNMSQKIKKINSKELTLRNNRYPSLLRTIKHIAFPNLRVLNLNSNKIVSLQQLPSFDLPVLNQINLDCNNITSTRSFVKAYLPQLTILRLQNNPVYDNSRMFQGFFPKLEQYWLDTDRNKQYAYGKRIQTDQVTWRIKHAPKLTKQNQLFARSYYHHYHYRRYGHEQDLIQPQGLTYVKYVQMLNQKPIYRKMINQQ